MNPMYYALGLILVVGLVIFGLLVVLARWFLSEESDSLIRKVPKWKE